MPVILEGCVGCGVCEMICPVEPPVIVIDSTREPGDECMSSVTDSVAAAGA